MSSDAARFWNQVPLAESALPAKYGPKFRCRISANAAAGPVELTAVLYLLETGPNPNKCIDRSFQTDTRAKVTPSATPRPPHRGPDGPRYVVHEQSVRVHGALATITV